jgi:hypothetical protein
MFRYSLVLLLGLGLACSAEASSWADAMFDARSRDFGSVPRGPTVSHPFRFVNNTGQPVRVNPHVRVSCGCVSARALHEWVMPGQESAIIAEMDTRRFMATKNVTIYVTFDQPRYEEVRLWVQANSRDDVALTPDTISFGRIKRGTAPAASLTVSLLGNPGWQVTGATCESNYVQPGVTLVRRNGYDVTYQLTAKMRPDAPPGRWYTDVWLTTNHPGMPRVRVPLTVEIESALTVSPGTVVLGKVKAGTEAERKVILRGVEPFVITKVTGTDGQVKVQDSTGERKAVHVLTVTLRPNQAGDLSRTLRVFTDLKGSENNIDFTAHAQVLP